MSYARFPVLAVPEKHPENSSQKYVLTTQLQFCDNSFVENCDPHTQQSLDNLLISCFTAGKLPILQVGVFAQQ
jgi:hypothetical protein